MTPVFIKLEIETGSSSLVSFTLQAMQKLASSLFASVIGFSLFACGDSKEAASSVDGGTNLLDSAAPSDAGGAGDAAATDDAAQTYIEPTNCDLRDDSGGPGQYSDGCVKRSWIEAYAGAYTSSKCELTVAVDGSVAATFTMKVLSGDFAGTYTTDWDGAPSPGNDSYYRFTTDATFATTKTLNFTSGQKVGASDERALGLRVEDLDKGSPVFKGRYAQVIGGKSDEVDCEVMTKK